MKANWDSLRTFYSSCPWSSGCSNDPSSIASFITDAILLGMDLFIPSSYKPGKKNSPKWFSSQCAKAMNNKNHCFKEWKRLQTQHSRPSFIQSRNTCSKTIKMPNHLLSNNKIASFWSMAKVVSQNFCPSSFPPLKNNSDSSSITPSSKANLFASVFASNSNLDDQGVQPHHFPPSKFTVSPIKFSTRKFRQTLLQLDTSNSKGPDGIPAIVLKPCPPEFAPIRNKLFQLSYTLGTFPTSWKQAHVFPIIKKGDKSNPLNYSPKAITSLISKTMETIITKQLLTFLETKNLPSDHQYGFRKASSTGDLLAYAVHVWSSALESSGESRVISLDISKAFDRVWHKASPICTLSMLLYPRALSSPLYSSSSSSMTCSPPRLLAFTPLLMIPS